jgi:hypothetical protein
MAKMSGDKSTPAMGPHPNVSDPFTPDPNKPFTADGPMYVPAIPEQQGFTNPWQAIQGPKPKPSP